MDDNWIQTTLRRPILGDGAMGTQLLLAGLRPGECPELWNVEHPDRVAAIHRAYVDAGSMFVTTNTFGGSSLNLGKHGFGDRARDLNVAAAKLAREAVGGRARVLGDIGPFGDFLEPLGDTTVDELTASFQEQAAALAEGGVDGFIVETMVDPTELATAVRTAKAVADLPVLATYAFNHSATIGFHTMMGATLQDAIDAALDAGADAVGANCGTDLSLDLYRALAERLLEAANGHPTVLQPNAGAPQLVDGQPRYLATPEDMAALATDALKMGISIVGGCCGTSPEHLAAMRLALDAS